MAHLGLKTGEEYRGRRQRGEKGAHPGYLHRGGVRQSGASIVTCGAPVLPGVMYLMGCSDGGTPVMGLSGCVMCAGAAVFNLVLPLVTADLPRVPKRGHGERADCALGAGPSAGSFGKREDVWKIKSNENSLR